MDNNSEMVIAQTMPNPSSPPKSNIGSMFADFGIGAASNLVSALINQAFARRNAEMNYQYGQRAADADYQRKLDFWNRENAYNSPQQQVQRRLQAGLSPFENVDSGNSQGLDTAITPNQAGLRGPIDYDYSIDLLDSMRTFSEINMMAKNGDKIDQEIANMIKQEYLLGLEAELKKLGKTELVERINNILADTSLKSSQSSYISTQKEYQSVMNARALNENRFLYTKPYYDSLLSTMIRDGKIADFDRTFMDSFYLPPSYALSLLQNASQFTGKLLEIFNPMDYISFFLGKAGKKLPGKKLRIKPRN